MAQGMTARRAMYERRLAASGGKLISWNLISDGDWDIAVVDEFPETLDNAASARFSAALKAAGALEMIRSFRLASPEDFDAAASEGESIYQAPTTAN